MSGCVDCPVRFFGFCRVITDDAIEEFHSIKTGPRSAPAKARVGGTGSGHAFVILRSGWAASYLLLRDGRVQISDLLYAGDAGPAARLFGPAAGGDMRAITAIEYCTLNVVQFRTLMARHPATASRFFDMAANLVEARDAALLRLGAMDAKEAVADLLMKLAAKIKNAGRKPEQATLPLSLKLVAEILGITIVHAGRILREFEALAIIERRRGGLRIIDAGMLTELAPMMVGKS